MGSENKRKTDLIHFVLEEGLLICNRPMTVEHVHDSFDGALVQFGFIVTDHER